jgi:hypothetical protein
MCDTTFTVTTPTLHSPVRIIHHHSHNFTSILQLPPLPCARSALDVVHVSICDAQHREICGAAVDVHDQPGFGPGDQKAVTHRCSSGFDLQMHLRLSETRNNVGLNVVSPFAQSFALNNNTYRAAHNIQNNNLTSSNSAVAAAARMASFFASV